MPDGNVDRARSDWRLAGLVLVPGVLVAGLAVTDALLAFGLSGQAAERRAQLAATEDVARELRELEERKVRLEALISAIVTLHSQQAPSREWERVLEAIPPEAARGPTRFCSPDEGVTFRGGREDETLLVELAARLQADARFRSATVEGRGTEQLRLTVVPVPLPPETEGGAP